MGEGRTAEVLRNLCFQVHTERGEDWKLLAKQLNDLFGTQIEPPRYMPERGEIEMSYRERGTRLDISSAGRGLQQTLLMLAYMYANPGAVLLLDEPDAHLETLRQRQTYRLLTDAARASKSQIIAASHSEVLLNEAAGRDLVIAFVGQPHRIDDSGSQALKALREIGFEQYYQAEQTGWVLYIEGPTDLAILHALARRLQHGAALRVVERAFVKYVENKPAAVHDHYCALREAVPELRGVAVFDRLGPEPPDMGPVECFVWKRRQLANYLCTQATLEGYAEASSSEALVGSLFTEQEADKRLCAMRQAIDEVASALKAQEKGSPWDADLTAGEDFLEPVFAAYFEKLGLPNLMVNKNFHELAEYIPDGEVDPEISEKLDAIVRVAESAKPSEKPA